MSSTVFNGDYRPRYVQGLSRATEYLQFGTLDIDLQEVDIRSIEDHIEGRHIDGKRLDTE